MPAVVRVKRRVNEEPLSAFILNAKRRRVDAEDTNKNLSIGSNNASANQQEITTLLKFAGTITEQSDDKAITEYARFSKVEARNIVAQKLKQPINLTDKARQEMRKHVQEQRFRVVNCMRTTLNADIVGNDDDNGDDTNDGTAVALKSGGGYENQPTKELTIVDIEKQQQNDMDNDNTMKLINESLTEAVTITAHNQSEPQPSTSTAAAAAAAATISENIQQEHSSTITSDDGYVYDLYFPENETFSYGDTIDLLEDYNLSCHPIDYQSTCLDFHSSDDCYNDRDEDADSEDSNCEDYYTNDYPDEDEFVYEDDNYNDNNYVEDNVTQSTEDLRSAIEKFIFDDEDDDDDNDTDDDEEKENEQSTNRFTNKKLLSSSDDDDYDDYYS